MWLAVGIDLDQRIAGFNAGAARGKTEQHAVDWCGDGLVTQPADNLARAHEVAYPPLRHEPAVPRRFDREAGSEADTAGTTAVGRMQGSGRLAATSAGNFGRICDRHIHVFAADKA